MKNQGNDNLEGLLKILASKLSDNIVTNAFQGNVLDKPIEEIFENKITSHVRSRNILIIGAGASKNVNDSIPLANEAIDFFKSEFTKKYGYEIINWHKSKISELSQIYKLNPEDFETQLLAYSILDKETVLYILKEKYDIKYPVSLFYEIIAHLFKHRFIDVIINFNFDEMLDNAIEEEMGDTRYKSIYSDGHCPNHTRDILDYEGILQEPIYIKPHGTISHVSTLRFTREAYYHTPFKIKELIIDLLKAKLGDPENPECEYLEVNLIIVGFGMKSHEFNQILKDHLNKTKSKIYYFEREGVNLVELKNRLINEEICSDNNILFYKVNNENTINKIFLKLWENIQENFKTIYQPKNITRHVILHEVFNCDGMIQRLLSKKNNRILLYFRDRLIFEIFFEIINSSDGLINLRQLKESRVQKYFSFFKYYSSKIGKEETESLFDFLEMYKLKPYRGYNRETWVFNPDDKEYIQNLLVYLKANISNLALEQFNANDQLRKNISILLERNKLFLNVRTRASDDYITVMSNIKTNNIIRTDIHWIYTFQSFFKEENIGNWDLILSVSETGGIFGGADISEKLDKKKLMLVCAYNTAWENDDVLGINDKANSSKKRKPNVTISDRRKLKLLNGKLSRIKDSVKLKLLHYRTHNNHLILFTKIKNDEIRFYGGIYYSRRQQTKRVTPIFTKNQDDLEQLFNIFANYWERATNEENMENFNEIIRQEKPNLNDIIFEVNKHKRHETVENIKARIIEEFNKL